MPDKSHAEVFHIGKEQKDRIMRLANGFIDACNAENASVAEVYITLEFLMDSFTNPQCARESSPPH